MTVRIVCQGLFIVAAAAVVSGCAAAYHDYSCGCIPYGYCPDRPLPFANYHGCPTPIAAGFSVTSPQARRESISETAFQAGVNQKASLGMPGK